MTSSIQPSVQIPRSTKTKPTKTKAREARDTRERILRATLRVIGEHGVEAVSNRRLAGEAGVALGSLTYHFPSQIELLRESLMLYVNEEAARLSDIAEAMRATGQTIEQVAGEIERIAAETQIGPEAIAELELHLQAVRDPALQDASRRCFAAYDEVAVAALQALGVPDPEAHARTAVALVSGFSLRRIGTGEPDASGLAHALVVLARGVGVPAAG